MKVRLEITNCRECPKLSSERYYTADSWETEYEWKCKLNDKHIAYVDWRESDQKRVKIPSWCPLRGGL
jgi:hypothetical protein